MAGTVNTQPPQARTTHTPDGAYEFELSEVGMLGAGAHGIVRAARHVVTGEVVAIKIMPASVLGAIAKELIAQAKMDHPHIVRLHATQVDLDRRRVYMIMELCHGGELFVRATPAPEGTPRACSAQRGFAARCSARHARPCARPRVAGPHSRVGQAR
jgi:hypothetical protein